MTSCVTDLPAYVEDYDASSPIVFGRIVSEVNGKTTRIYPPRIRFFELSNRQTGERFKILIEADDLTFSFQVAAGNYELSRVQIGEGPFMSMADYAVGFEVGQGRVYVGTWRFRIDVPRYGRLMTFSVVWEEEDRQAAERKIFPETVDSRNVAVMEVPLSPSQAEARLYEVMPYPLYPRYFRRHWW